MDEERLRMMIKAAVKESFKESLMGIGIDVSDPTAVQADHLYLRKLRKGSEIMGLRVKLTLIGTLVPAGLYLLWDAITKSKGG